jgi:hypothetical protein
MTDARAAALGSPTSPWGDADSFLVRNGSKIAYSAMATSVLFFVAIAVVVLFRSDHLGADAAIGLVAALVPGVVSVVVSGFSHLSQIRAASERDELRTRELEERKDVRVEELVLRSLEYFTGKTQRRSVGIAVVEGAWRDAPHLHKVFVPLLANQALYLLKVSRSVHSSHESENLKRMMALLTRESVVKEYGAVHLGSIADALAERQRSRSDRRSRGVELEEDDVRKWLLALGV